ncbi:DNA polymerase alpha subunit B, partial [Guillardia theta CCMP2712]
MKVVSEAEIVNTFKALGHDIQGQDELIGQCVELCETFDFSATDLGFRWESHADQLAIDGPPRVEHLQALKLSFSRKSDKKGQRTSRRVGVSKLYTKESISMLQESLSSTMAANYGGDVHLKLEANSANQLPKDSFVTPLKRRANFQASSSSKLRCLPSTPSQLVSPMGETPDSAKYSGRSNKLQVFQSVNEALPSAPSRGSSESSRCEVKQLQGLTDNGRGFGRYMFEKVEQKCISLRNRLMENTDRIVENEKLKEKAEKAGESFSLSPVNAPSQDLAWFCGRICVEGDSGLINATSVFIEGVNGRRVKLDLSRSGEFAVFPGQIVVIHGTNADGNCIVAHSIHSDASVPLMKTPAGQMAIFNETKEFLGGQPLSIVAASGPYTTSADLNYSPLDDLLEYVRKESPDVLVLCGPFVDYQHRLLDPSKAGTPGGFSNGDPPDTLTLVRNVLHSDQENAMDVSLCMMGNPCMFRINEVVVGVTTTDIVRHICGCESSISNGDRISRVINHLIQQKSFYPLFPPAEGAQLAMSNYHHLEFQNTPDVLIVPSHLCAYAKRASDVLCVNPGRLVKGNTAGTFAKLTIHPVNRHIRDMSEQKQEESPQVVAREPEDMESPGQEPVVPQQLNKDFDSVMEPAKSDTSKPVPLTEGEKSADPEQQKVTDQEMEEVAGTVKGAGEEKAAPEEEKAKGEEDKATGEDKQQATGEGEAARVNEEEKAAEREDVPTETPRKGQ